MARSKKSNAPVYACTECKSPSTGWAGQCARCGAWGTIELQAAPAGGSASLQGARPALVTQSLADLHQEYSPPSPTGIDELDRVLGGGLTAGSVVLLGGEPGIGKSTLTLQAALRVAARGATSLIVAGEEAPAQIAARAERLGAVPATVKVIDGTVAEDIATTVTELRPQLVIVDSIQTVCSVDQDGPPGTVGQLKAATDVLVRSARLSGATIIMVGHITKDGSLAGPKVVEHMVDVVLSFSGDRSGVLRYLRALKNRFGTTSEMGLFQMESSGLEAVPDPSGVFLRERRVGAPGSVVAAVLEGTRPVLLEIQALITPGWSTAGGMRLTVQGVPRRRVELVVAVLRQHANQDISGEVFVSVAGGATAEEPGIDVAIALALVSASTATPVSGDTVWFGEVGLAGELRCVPQHALRLQEAQRLGFRHAVAPDASGRTPAGLHVTTANTILAAVDSGLAVSP